ncbi:hypothetical protein ANN_09998 [Periplaneta americana]|uniref:Uncharacterized protein n=1 Tax=Periplaneta americana TaxID=6978 RepID=A0ABQ8TMV0_PERAM|nr:hypothetical protein ANN_09998 [Periplaneta americana]
MEEEAREGRKRIRNERKGSEKSSFLIFLTWLFNDTVSTIRLFSVDGIDGSEMVFGEMRPRIRHRLPEICLTVGQNLGKTKPGNQPKLELNPRPNETSDRQANTFADRATPVGIVLNEKNQKKKNETDKIKSGWRKNDAETDQEEKKELIGSLAEKKLPTEGCTGRNGDREKSSGSNNSNSNNSSSSSSNNNNNNNSSSSSSKQQQQQQQQLFETFQTRKVKYFTIAVHSSSNRGGHSYKISNSDIADLSSVSVADFELLDAGGIAVEEDLVAADLCDRGYFAAAPAEGSGIDILGMDCVAAGRRSPDACSTVVEMACCEDSGSSLWQAACLQQIEFITKIGISYIMKWLPIMG